MILSRMPARTSKKTHLKAKKSYSLSPESVAFLESLRKNRRAASTSAVLDEILQHVRRQQKEASIESAVAEYYSSLSRGEGAECTEWGEFALREFPCQDS